MPAWMVCRPASAVFLLQYDQSRLGEGSKSPSKVKLLPFCCQMLPILEALLCSWLHHPASPINHTIPLIQWNLSNIKVVGWEGLEPSTNALKGRCSTIELPTRSPAPNQERELHPSGLSCAHQPFTWRIGATSHINSQSPGRRKSLPGEDGLIWEQALSLRLRRAPSG
jgi:hypothetical protein